MLVLSRQENQRIRFPGLGISVEILDIRGSKVRVGVDAPIEVRVLRDELEEFDDATAAAKTAKAAAQKGASEPKVIQLPREIRHELRNTLHELSLMVHVYRKQSEKAGKGAGEVAPDEMFEAIVERLNSLSSHNALTKQGVLAAEPEEGGDATLGRALIVDDDDNERMLMSGFLQMCGYQVSSAINGVEALEQLRNNAPPRVILLDMNMPECNGQEFLRQVREVPGWDGVHIFVVSGAQAADFGLSQEDGYTHWFQKPLDPRLIVDRLNKVEARKVG